MLREIVIRYSMIQKYFMMAKSMGDIKHDTSCETLNHVFIPGQHLFHLCNYPFAGELSDSGRSKVPRLDQRNHLYSGWYPQLVYSLRSFGQVYLQSQQDESRHRVNQYDIWQSTDDCEDIKLIIDLQ